MIIIKKPSLVTIDIFYYIPDYPSLVNEFIWQTEDYVPSIPKVHKFLKYWKNNNLAVVKEILICHSDNNKYNYTEFYQKI